MSWRGVLGLAGAEEASLGWWLCRWWSFVLDFARPRFARVRQGKICGVESPCGHWLGQARVVVRARSLLSLYHSIVCMRSISAAIHTHTPFAAHIKCWPLLHTRLIRPPGVECQGKQASVKR